MTVETLNHFKKSPILAEAIQYLLDELQNDKVTPIDLLELGETVTDHYIYYHESLEALTEVKGIDIFDYIDFIVETENERYGESYTDLTKPYFVANATLSNFIVEIFFSNELLSELYYEDESKPLTENEKLELETYFKDLIP